VEVRQGQPIVENFQNAINTLLRLLTEFGVAVAAVLTGFELWLREALRNLGVQPQFQTLILVLVAVVLVIGSLRLFGGLIRVAAVLILLLIAIHIVLPVIQG
jgi:hypothetical protein